MKGRQFVENFQKLGTKGSLDSQFLQKHGIGCFNSPKLQKIATRCFVILIFFKKTRPMIFELMISRIFNFGFLGEKIKILVIFQIMVENFHNSNDFSNFG
jgi:hypothetical protein